MYTLEDYLLNSNFADKWDAIIWMCHNQMGRRNLSDTQRTVLIAEAFKAQKMTHGGDRRSGEFSKDQNGLLKSERSKSIVAKRFGVGQGTVQRAEQFANGLDAAEQASPGIRESVLSGEVKACFTGTKALFVFFGY